MGNVRVDDLEIAYSDLGTSEGLPLVCLTGWCSSRARYDQFLPRAGEGRRVISLDWRGHGESDRPAGDFTVTDLVRDVAAVVETAGLSKFAVASASHSGWAAIELRRQFGERIPCLVHMDWLVVEPSQPYMELIQKLQTDAWMEARDTLFEIWRGGIDNPAVEAAIDVMNEHGAEMWQRSGREIEGSFQTNGSPLTALAKLDSQPRVLHLYGQPRDPSYLARQQAFAADHPWFEVTQVGARSHFSMIEVPDEAVAAIDAFLAAESKTSR